MPLTRTLKSRKPIIMNNIFLDSSVLVEFRKGARTELIEAILEDDRVTPCISQAGASEYLFHHLAIFGGKSPLSIKSDKDISAVMSQFDPAPFLSLFRWLSDDFGMLQLAVESMSKYGLLSNDALIIACCKWHNVQAIASFDSDFLVVCAAEGLSLLTTTEDFSSYKAHYL